MCELYYTTIPVSFAISASVRVKNTKIYNIDKEHLTNIFDLWYRKIWNITFTWIDLR